MNCMDYQTYLMQIKTNLSDSKAIALDNYDATVAYEEVFKWEWFATKLKIFSFVTYAETIDRNQLENYSSICLGYARKHKKGLPIGLQNGIVSNNVFVSESVDDDVISLVTSRPKKHYSVFEMPIILDLSKSILYCYKGEIVWGKIYNTFIQDYIVKNFNI